VSFLFAGFDKHYGFQLYQSDPSGNYSGWKATVIGANNQSGKSLLKTEYASSKGNEGEDKGEEMKTEETSEKKEDELVMPDLYEALRLAVKVLNKTMDAQASSAEKMELFTMTLENEKCVHKILSKEDVQKVISEVEAESATAGDL